MAKPTTFGAQKLLIEIGDGAAPEVFSAPCGLSSKGLNRSAEVAEAAIPDCDNPDAPAWTDRDVDTLSWEVSGSGWLTAAGVPIWDGWFEAGAAKSLRVTVMSGAGAGRVYTGKGVLTQYNISGEGRQRVQVEITISGSGALASAAAS